VKRRGKIQLALLSLVISLILAEVAVDRWYPIGVPSYRLDAELHHATIPGSRRIQPMPERTGGARNLIAINSTGYRGPELGARKRPLVAVVGDSMVMAENVPYRDCFPARLEAHLEGRYQVVNVGASGYGPDQALLRVEREWAVLRPDLVLLVLCATNDHGDVLRNKLFRLDPQGRAERRRPKLGSEVIEYFQEAGRRGNDLALVRLWRAWGHHRRREARFAEEELEAPLDHMPLYLAAATQELEQLGDPLVPDLLHDYYDADIAISPDSPSVRVKRELLTAVLVRWAETCAQRRTPLAAVIVPSAVDVDPTFHIRVDPALYPTYDPRALDRAFEEALATAGIPGRNLFELFAENDPADLFVGIDDIHWNARGIDLAARETARWVSATWTLSLPD